MLRWNIICQHLDLDKLKNSPVDQNVAESVSDKLNQNFGEESRLSTALGKFLYLGKKMTKDTTGTRYCQCMTLLIMPPDMEVAKKCGRASASNIYSE